MYSNQIYWNTTIFNTRIKPIMRLCIPKNAHTWMILHFFCIKKKKKDRPTDPPNFQAKRANKPFIFRPYFYLSFCTSRVSYYCTFNQKLVP